MSEAQEEGEGWKKRPTQGLWTASSTCFVWALYLMEPVLPSLYYP